MVDDCHATGLMGETGGGTGQAAGVGGDVDIVTSTLGKALGGGTGETGGGFFWVFLV